MNVPQALTATEPVPVTDQQSQLQDLQRQVQELQKQTAAGSAGQTNQPL